MLPSMNIFLLYAMPLTILMIVFHMNKQTKNSSLKKKIFLFSMLGILSIGIDFFYSWYLGFPTSKNVEGYVALVKDITFYSTQACMLITVWYSFKMIEERKISN